ncbi:hypothetical protein MRS44_004052 [Fusarium solani]|uniref:uncharacterized protein n=1 Tax=Fusarium solani TaxID=169388 RepID=UPI0032C3EFBC|nr:hypothetical protein MRS44_004052 [Fusarium solani]
MPKYTDEDLNEAIQTVKNGRSVVKAANQHGVPRSSLRDRLAGKEPKGRAHEGQQRLSHALEKELCDWLRVQDALGTPLTHFQIRQLVQRVLLVQGDSRPLGKHWIDRFIARNQRIKTLRAVRIEAKRIRGSKAVIIRAWFDQLKDPEVIVIRHWHRWNMDEIGIFQGVGLNGLVVGQSERRKAIKKDPKLRNWVTITECVSADGRVLPPLVIFKGQEPQQQWFPEDPSFMSNWLFTASPKGWTTNVIGHEWLEKVFIPYTKPAEANEKRLLFLDGHDSHLTEAFIFGCFRANIHPCHLPPHTSHILQPLDLSCFSILKRNYRNELSLVAPLVEEGPTAKATFLRCYHKARAAAFTEEHIKSGWRGSGLWPINIQKPLSSRFVIPDEEEAQAAQGGNLTPEAANQEPEVPLFYTPKRTEDIANLARDLFEVEQLTPTHRHFCRLAGRSLEKETLKRVMESDRADQLEARMSQSRVAKRRKVNKPPDQVVREMRDLFATRSQMRQEEEKEAC